MQLVAYGAQDIYLTGQPQITFFKSVYRRHTNFAMESIQQTINGAVSQGQQPTSTITRNGDLILGMHVDFPNAETVSINGANGQMVCPSGNLALNAPSFCEDLGFKNNPYSLYTPFLLFEHITLKIGGQEIDKIHSEWMVAYSELVYRKDGTRDQFGYALNNPIGDPNGFGNSSGASATGGQLGVGPLGPLGGRNCMVPFLFYFNNNPGLAIPLIALQYHEVQVVMKLPATADIPASIAPTSGNTVFTDMVLMVDYVYLDTTERRKFAQNAHEYLITQHQRQQDQTGMTSSAAAPVNVRLNLNHPVKYIMWWTNGRIVVPTPQLLPYMADMTTFTNINCTAYNQAKITLNGSDRFSFRNMKYFTGTQVYQHWPADCPNQTFSILNGSLYLQPSVYSFAIRPAEHQPSGTCNFSRIDNAQLQMTGVVGVAYGNGSGQTAPTPDRVTIFAENYNVLRIMSGMGGLAYSN